MSRCRIYGKWRLFESYHILQWDNYILLGDNVDGDSLLVGIVSTAIPEEIYPQGLGLILKKQTYERLGELLENIKTAMTNLAKVFPSGIPTSPADIVSASQKETFSDFNRAWQALLLFRLRHPLLGSS